MKKIFNNSNGFEILELLIWINIFWGIFLVINKIHQETLNNIYEKKSQLHQGPKFSYEISRED